MKINAALVDIHLHGPLGDQFGPLHRFAVRSPGEALRALEANRRGFRQAFVAHAHYGILVDGDWIAGDDVVDIPISREVHFVPVIEGQAIAAPLIAAAGPILTNIAVQIIGAVIVSALVWGISQLFAKKPDETEGEDKSESYVFGGAANIAQQGAAVPVIYGRCFVGSVVVSAGMAAGEQVILSGTSRSGYMAEPVRRDTPEQPPEHLGWREPFPPLPPIVLRDVDAPDGSGVPLKRVGPEGWDHIGTQTLVEEDHIRVVDLFQSPDGVRVWDYLRGQYDRDESVMVP